MGVISPKLRERDARDLFRHLGGGDGQAAALDVVSRVRDAIGAALGRVDRRPGKAAAIGVRALRRPPRAGNWATKKLRRAVWQRSEGHCENDECNARISWSTFELDHFLGRARAPQKPANCWALCQDCHRRKHAGDPGRTWWQEKFLAFIERRFPGSPTVQSVQAQIEAERLIAKAEAIRANTCAAEDGDQLLGRVRYGQALPCLRHGAAPKMSGAAPDSGRAAPQARQVPEKYQREFEVAAGLVAGGPHQLAWEADVLTTGVALVCTCGRRLEADILQERSSEHVLFHQLLARMGQAHAPEVTRG